MFLTTVLFYSCEKEQVSYQAISDNNSNNVSARTSDGTSSQSKIDWVKGFQGHLQDLQSGTTTSSNYTLEEAAYGLEYLFNYTYGDIQIGVNLGGTKTSFPIPSNKNWLELYNNIYTQIQEEKNPELNFDFVTVEVNIESNSVDIQTHYKTAIPEKVGSILNSEGNTFDCENPPFGEEEFIFAFGGREEDGLDFRPCNVEDDCGNGPVTADDPHLIALELIEIITNGSIRADYYCKEAGQAAAFTNIGTIFQTPIGIYNIVRDTYLCPELTDNELDNTNICDCASASVLNCIFCFTEELLISEEITSQIPEGSEIVDINLGTNAVNFDGLAFYDIVITYAEVTCVPDEREEPPILIGCC